MGKGRQRKIGSLGNPVYKAKTPAEIIHFDSIGPISTVKDGVRQRVPTLSGSLYALIGTDDKTSYVSVTLTKTKAELAPCVVSTLNYLQTQSSQTVRRIHSDGGKEFINTTIQDYCNRHGIKQTFTTPDTPALNGKAERMNQSLITMTRSMMNQASAPPYLWGESLVTSAYLKDRTIRSYKDVDQPMTPHEYLLGQAPKIDHIRVWGCDCYVFLPESARGKFNGKFARGIFIGYAEQQSAYRILIPSSFKIIISRSVKFNEASFTLMKQLPRSYHSSVNHAEIDLTLFGDQPILDNDMVFGHSEAKDDVTITNNTLSPSNCDIPSSMAPVISSISTVSMAPSVNTIPVDMEAKYDSDNSNESIPPMHPLSPIREEDQEAIFDNDGDDHLDISDSIDEGNCTSIDLQQVIDTAPPPTTSRYGRTIKSIPRLGMIDKNDLHPADRALVIQSSLEPTTFRQAIHSKDSLHWNKAMDDEIVSMELQDVYEVCERPPHVKPIPCRWVFKIKTDELNRPVRYKARLVAKGFKQVQDIDYTETFSPVAKFKSVRMALSIVNQFDLELKQLDFQTAFLNATLPDDIHIYAELPEGFYEKERQAGKVLKLKKALYGLKQSPREWNLELTSTLRSLGYEPIQCDPCIFVKRTDRGSILLCLYVDDTILGYSKEVESIWLQDKKIISEKYPISDLGDCKWILKMLVTRDRTNGSLTLSQEAYVKTILEQYGMTNCKPTVNPCMLDDLSDHYYITRGESVKYLNKEEHSRYRSIVGALLYLSNMTRMDISYMTGLLSRQVSKPTQLHLSAVMHLLRYLSGTAHYHLVYKKAIDFAVSNPVLAYTDASWGNDTTDRKSITGLIVLLFGNPISWNSKKQPTVATSSCEAEYMAISYTTQELLWCRMWISEVLKTVLASTSIYTDSQSAIDLCKNDAYHQRTKHIDIRHHFIRDHVHNGNIQLKWISTTEQKADLLTKDLSTKLLTGHLSSLLGGV